MNYRQAVFAIALACGTATTAAYAGPRAVIELFTSQGCSSCPPADRLLGELAKDPTLLTMSLPVDYWDYLGWKDTLALHGHSKRERAYANVRGAREVYTPQVVVNGLIHVLGSDKAGIEHALDTSRSEGASLKLPVTLAVSDGTVTVHVSDALGDHRSGEVWLCPVTAKIPVEIKRGENRGRTLTYTNVVRSWIKLGDWTGKAQTFTAKLADLQKKNVSLNKINRLDVIVQEGVASKPGMMLGAATASLQN
jgi:hypothetical protein